MHVQSNAPKHGHAVLTEGLVEELGERRGVVMVLLAGVELDKTVVLERLEGLLGEGSGVEGDDLVGQILGVESTNAGDGAPVSSQTTFSSISKAYVLRMLGETIYSSMQ
jgi:hypothetical protein